MEVPRYPTLHAIMVDTETLMNVVNVDVRLVLQEINVNNSTQRQVGSIDNLIIVITEVFNISIRAC